MAFGHDTSSLGAAGPRQSEFDYDASGLLPGAYSYIASHIDDLHSIPPPDRTWEASDLDAAARPHLQRLAEDGAITVVGTGDDGANEYETTTAGWRAIQDSQTDRDLLLCGHSGIRNIGDGLFECGHDDCDHRYTRDTIQLVFLDETLSE